MLAKASYSQTDSVGSGHALKFDGIQDYVVLGDEYHNLNFPFSVSAWVFLDPTSLGSPIFVTNDNNPLYRGFWFVISPNVLECEFGDGTGGNNPAFRQGKIASIQNVTSRWINVCAVMTSPSNINLYINGVNIGGNPSGGSSLTIASSFTGDTPKIGYFLSNGSAYHFKGTLDEVKLWNRSLTQDEVRQDMCKKLKGNETGLIGYWPFDETSGNTVFDKSPNGFNGQTQGNPQRVFSGAPIGNSSTFLYPPSGWTGTNISMTDGADKVTVSNIQGNPEGIQIYEVKNLPSQITGLNLSKISQPYFGVFAATSAGASNSFDVNYTYQNANSCSLFSRNNNSIPNWAVSPNPATQVSHQIEVIKISGSKINLDLGADQILCNQTSATLSTGLSDPTLTYLWNNGMTSPSIVVATSGEYVIRVSGDCGTVKDSVRLTFSEPPTAFSLGVDQKLCQLQPMPLKPFSDTTGLTFLWQDGSKWSTFKVNDFGTYWLTVKNYCGQASDTLHVVKNELLDYSKLPNVITPNGDGKNDFYKIPDQFLGQLNIEVFNRWGKKVFHEIGYMNDWDGGDLDPGIYFMLVTGGCIEKYKSSVTILK